MPTLKDSEIIELYRNGLSITAITKRLAGLEHCVPSSAKERVEQVIFDYLFQDAGKIKKA